MLQDMQANVLSSKDMLPAREGPKLASSSVARVPNVLSGRGTLCTLPERFPIAPAPPKWHDCNRQVTKA